MPVGATSSYSEGQGSLTAVPYAQATGIRDITGLLKKLRPQAEQPVYEAPQMTAGVQNRAVFGSNGGRSALETEQLKQAKLQTREMANKLRARSQAAPTKELFGFGMHGRVLEDPEKLNAYQREIYLPQGAQQVGGMPQSGASLSPDMPGVEQAPDEGGMFRRASLADALRQSNAEFSAGQQRRGLMMPSSAYGR